MITNEDSLIQDALSLCQDDLTDNAEKIWNIIFPGERWPFGVIVSFVPYMRRAMGLTLYFRREILLSQADHTTNEEIVDTLIHEFVHLRGYRRHNATFYRIENECRARLGLPPMPDERALRRARREEKQRRAAAALTEWHEKYGKLPLPGDEVISLEANRDFPAGVWGTIINVRGSCVKVRWGVTKIVWRYWHDGLRLIRPTGGKRCVKGRPRLLRKASEVTPVPNEFEREQAG